MATRTTTQSGNWNSTSTWGGNPVPGIGDRVQIGHHVVVTADTTVGEKLSDATNAIYFTGGPGSLTVNDGVLLSVRGFLYGNDAGALTLGAGSILEFDVPVGWRYSLKHYSATFTINGTQAAPAIVRSKPGGGVADILCWTGFEAPIDANWCDFTDLGSATVEAIYSGYPSATGIFSLRHCRFIRCGQLYQYREVGTAINRVEDCTWTGTLHATKSAQVATTTARSTGTYSFARNILDKRLYSTGMRDYTIEDCFFDDVPELLSGGGSNYNGSLMRRCLVRKPAHSDTNWPIATTQDVYWVEDHTTANPHFLSPNSPRNYLIEGMLFEYSGTDSQGDCITQAPSSGFELIIQYCLVVPNADGAGRAGPISSHGGFPGTTVPLGEATGGLDYAGQIPQYQSNLCVACVGASGAFAVSDVGLAVTNVMTPSGATHNCHGPGIAAGSSGKGYNYATTGTAPGANDLPLGTDPQFVDRTRRLSKWDLSLGGPGTTAGAMARLRADPLLLASSAIPYVRQGFSPTNPLLLNAGHDGVTIGAVAYTAAGGIGPVGGRSKSPLVGSPLVR